MYAIMFQIVVSFLLNDFDIIKGLIYYSKQLKDMSTRICMEEPEVWKIFPLNDNYEVSNLGKVRNKKTKRIRRPSGNNSYQKIGLCRDGISKSYSIHQMVGITFLENKDSKPQINHLDKQKNNNDVSNLQWCTAAENNAHKCLTLKVETNQNLKVWRVDINSGERLELYDSIKDAAEWCVEHGFASTLESSAGNIGNVIRGVYKKSCGFKWYLNEQPDLENEVWKNITIHGKTFNNYFVSNLGRFKNYKGIIMENYKPHHTGYIYVRVEKKKYSLHHLVASTFIENPLSKPIVIHLDGNKTNNCVVNLEWGTLSEDAKHSHEIGLIKCFTRRIGQYNLEGDLIKEYDSIVQAMKETNIKSIKEVLYNKQKTAGGFIWKYLDE